MQSSVGDQKNLKKAKSKLVNWVEKTWKYLFNTEEIPKHPLEEELSVPRHAWVGPTELFGRDYWGKRIEVPVLDDRFGGQTNVVGRLTSMTYDSSDRRTTLEIQGPHFVASVDIYPEMLIMVHL